MSGLVDFTIYPMDKGVSLSKYVARALTVIKKSGLSYRLGPMSTSIEGEWDQVMGVVDQCFDELRNDCDRISMMIRVDYRKGATGRMESKVTAVQKQMG